MIALYMTRSNAMGGQNIGQVLAVQLSGPIKDAVLDSVNIADELKSQCPDARGEPAKDTMKRWSGWEGQSRFMMFLLRRGRALPIQL